MEILDFPCNQFGSQAPGTIQEIHQFCTANFAIQFPQFDKIDVNGVNESPLYTYLKSQKGFGGFDFGSMDFSDIFSDLFGGAFGGGFGGFSSFGGGSGRKSSRPRQGESIRTRVTITFDEAMKGTKKQITIPYEEECKSCHGSGAKPGTSPITCPKCGGRGQVTVQQRTPFGIMQSVSTCPDCNGSGKVIKERCPDCNGTGYNRTQKTFEVSIPAGIDNGQSVRVSGGGNPGENGGPRGDLLVGVTVSQHPILKRQGVNIFSTVSIDYPTAVLGGETKVKTADGDVMLTIKPGTQSGYQPLNSAYQMFLRNNNLHHPTNPNNSCPRKVRN